MVSALLIIMKSRIILLGIMIIIIFISGCVIEPRSPEPNPIFINDTNMSDNQTNNDNLEFIFLGKEGTIEQGSCSARKLDDKVIIMESRYCGACRIAVPRLKEIEEELNTEFIFLDLSQQCDSDRMMEFRIMPQYTPTILIGCDVHIGAKSKEVFKQAIEDFLSR